MNVRCRLGVQANETERFSNEGRTKDVPSPGSCLCAKDWRRCGLTHSASCCTRSVQIRKDRKEGVKSRRPREFEESGFSGGMSRCGAPEGEINEWFREKAGRWDGYGLDEVRASCR